MVGIQGLGGVPEPKPGGPAKARNDRGSAARDAYSAGSDAPAKDDISISTEAKAAAEAGRLVQLSKNDDDVRLDRVEQAKQNIAEGKYKDPEVVSQVAEKLIKYIF